MGTSSKKLAFMRDTRHEEPLYALAVDFIQVWRINGHVPDDDELQEALHLSNLWSPAAVNDLREAVNALEPAFR